jgi:hypothetical protein
MTLYTLAASGLLATLGFLIVPLSMDDPLDVVVVAHDSTHTLDCRWCSSSPPPDVEMAVAPRLGMDLAVDTVARPRSSGSSVGLPPPALRDPLRQLLRECLRDLLVARYRADQTSQQVAETAGASRRGPGPSPERPS